MFCVLLHPICVWLCQRAEPLIRQTYRMPGVCFDGHGATWLCLAFRDIVRTVTVQICATKFVAFISYLIVHTSVHTFLMVGVAARTRHWRGLRGR